MGKKNNTYYISKCRSEVFKGNAKQLIQRYMQLARFEDDPTRKQMYLNYHEHYMKVTSKPHESDLS
jgi:hypothetical protein